MNFSTKKIFERKLNGGMQTQVQLFKLNSDFTSNDVKNIITKLHQDAETKGEDIRLMVRGLAIDKWATLKSFGEDQFNEDAYLEYFENRVKNVSKFQNFSQLQVTMVKYDN